jgi:hypothetical protein
VRKGDRVTDPITTPRLFCHACREWYDDGAFAADKRGKMAHRRYRRNECRVCRSIMRRGNGEYARNYQRKLVRRFRRLAWQWLEFGGEGIVNGLEESTDGVDLSLNKRQRRATTQRELFEVRE